MRCLRETLDTGRQGDTFAMLRKVASHLKFYTQPICQVCKIIELPFMPSFCFAKIGVKQRESKNGNQKWEIADPTITAVKEA